jgi:paraquat-inducible protein B
MSKPASKTLIGIFVLGAIALAVIGIVVLGSGKFFKQTLEVVCYFDGDIKGLNVGSPVVFKGVKVGSVTNILLRFDPQKLDFKIPVFIEIEPDRIETIGPRPTRKGEKMKPLIDKGLRAQLEMQSFVTGQLQVALDFFPDKPAKFVGTDPKYIEIPTVPTPLEQLAKKLEELPLEKIMKDVASAVDGINRVINSPEIRKTIQAVSVAAEETKNLIHNVNTRIDPVLVNIDAAVKDAQNLLRTVNRQVEPLGPSIEKSFDGIEKTIKSAEATLNAAQKTIEGIDRTVGEGSTVAYELEKTLGEVRSLARSVRQLTDYLERHPESLLRGK